MFKVFINRNTDLDTVNFLAKSIPSEVMEKALDKTHLVQKEVIRHDETGEHTVKKWIDPDKDKEKEKPARSTSDNKEKPKKRESIPATPHKITTKTKHLREWSAGEPLPKHLQSAQIPPGWRNVMVSDDPDAELQAIGKDDQNRTQYVYHPDYVKAKSEQKFRRIQDLMSKRKEMGEFIDKLKAVDPDTSDCLKLIYHTGIRPGSTKDTKSKVEAIGATTLRGEHVVVDKGKVFLRFIGKKGVKQNHEVENPELVKMLLSRKESAGDDKPIFNTTSDKLRKVLPPGVHPKDLRTMLATWTASEYLKGKKETDDPKEFNKLSHVSSSKQLKASDKNLSFLSTRFISPNDK